LRKSDDQPAETIGPGRQAIVDLISNTLGALAGPLSHTFLVFLAAIFILFEAAEFRAELRLACGGRGVNLTGSEQDRQPV
jgi:predicted PurR-regulated permease PerM